MTYALFFSGKSFSTTITACKERPEGQAQDIILLPYNMICDKSILLSALHRCDRNLITRQVRSRKPHMEFLRALTGERQIKKARAMVEGSKGPYICLRFLPSGEHSKGNDLPENENSLELPECPYNDSWGNCRKCPRRVWEFWGIQEDELPDNALFLQVVMERGALILLDRKNL